MEATSKESQYTINYPPLFLLLKQRVQAVRHRALLLVVVIRRTEDSVNDLNPHHQYMRLGIEKEKGN